MSAIFWDHDFDDSLVYTTDGWSSLQLFCEYVVVVLMTVLVVVVDVKRGQMLEAEAEAIT